ncbi:MAG: TonB-dependent receptor, partial [Oscillospiraceae bacterium]|nr:TonB-dependent receptor [Oscillospiraceae bacterium]
EGTNLMKDFDVYINTDGETYRYIINNSVFKSFIKVVKKDAESGNTIPLAGSAFRLYGPDGNKIEMTYTYPEVTTIDTFYTNEDGYLITPESLPYGTGYSIHEVQAPYGYVLNTDRVYFDVTADNSSEDNGVTVIEVAKNNLAQKGVIKIQKAGEVFASVTNSNGVYQPVYEIQGLAGARYEIRAAEDIYTPDGTLRASQWEYIDTVETGIDGIGISKELYLGKYQIAEVTALMVWL